MTAGGADSNSSALDPFGYPINTVSPPEIRQLLRNREFAKLNKILQGYQDEYERDFAGNTLCETPISACPSTTGLQHIQTAELGWMIR